MWTPIDQSKVDEAFGTDDGTWTAYFNQRTDKHGRCDHRFASPNRIHVYRFVVFICAITQV